MEPKTHRLEQSGCKLWATATASDGSSTAAQVAPQAIARVTETVEGGALLEAIMGDMRARNNASFPKVSAGYEGWRAKSSISKLLDGDINETWEAREAAETEEEGAYWGRLAVERRASQAKDR